MKNINKAKEIIRKSGINSGNITLLLNTTVKNNSYQKILIEDLYNGLKEIGLNLKVLEVGNKEYYIEEIRQKCDLLYYGCVGDNGTKDNFIQPFIEEEGYANIGKYLNEEILNLIKELKTIKNPYKYNEKLKSIENMLLEDMPYIFLTLTCTCYAHKENVKGISVHPLIFVKLQDVWIE